MDERSHHHQHAHGSQQAIPLGATQHGQPGPWPGHQPPVHHAPISGHAPFPGPAAHPQVPQQPSSHQFQYAASGFVLPGAAGGDAPPMSAHGGMIGTPLQHGAPMPGSMPLLNGHDPSHAALAAPAGHAYGAVAHDPFTQPQAWAFPTPHGLQMVHPDAVAHAPHRSVHAQPDQLHMQHQQQHDATMHARVDAGVVGPVRRRMRWETIVPGAAVACLIAAVALFISDFDRITGRSAATAESAAASASASRESDATGGPSASEATDDASAVVSEATALFEAGRFDEAANLLHPVLDSDAPDPAAVALHDRVDAAGERNRALLAQLQRQRRASRWPAVVATIAQLEQLRPLSTDLVTLRRSARSAIASNRTAERASAMMRQGRDAEALALVERALKAAPNRRLQALRERISARRAAPSSSPSNRATTSGGGGGRAMPPMAGGRPAAVANVRPPASVPAGAIPARPDAPNPVSSGGVGAAAVGGGAGAGGSGAGCHTHGGVTECH